VPFVAVIALLYFIMWSKGGYSNLEARLCAVTAILVGTALSISARKAESVSEARWKLASWPLAILLFISFPLFGLDLDNPAVHATFDEAIFPLCVAAMIGTTFGFLHYATAIRRLRKLIPPDRGA
jgi:hypothetical protein